jgi:imidazoleglycerol-phosphate dehydratase
MRKAEVTRETKETTISILFDPDKRGTVSSDTGMPFMDHMLESFARHGGFSLTVKAAGDLEVDPHHTVEDTGIVLGTAVRKSLGDARGIRRFAHAVIPMDESRAAAVLDISGRGYLVMDGEFTGISTGGIPNDLIEHFFYSFCIHAGITAHILFSGVSDHHKCEAIFKAFGIALGMALEILPDRTNEIPSTKGTL